MDELAKLRREKHNQYLQKKEENSLTAAVPWPAATPIEDQSIATFEEIDNDSNNNNNNNENNGNENVEINTNDNNQEDDVIENNEENEENEEDEEDEEDEEVNGNGNLLGGNGGGIQNMFPAGYQAGYMNNNMNHQVGFTGAHHFGIGYNHQHIHGYQPFGGHGQQLTGNGGNHNSYGTNDVFSQGYNNGAFSLNQQGNENQEPQEPTTTEEKRATFLSSIESRHIKSPDLVSENQKRESRKKEFRIPFENFKSLIQLCLYKMSLDLTPFQFQLKLLSGDLIHRLIEVMVKNNRLTHTKLKQILSSGCKVYKLDLSNQSLIVNNDFLLNSFKYFVEIQDVSFSNCINITDYGLETFKSEKLCKNLKILDLRYNRNITDVGMKHLKNLVNLEELYLGSTSITDIGIALLNKLVNLKTFDISRCKVTDSSMVTICLFTKLQLLNLSETNITDEAILKIHQILTNIQYLYLANCTKLTNKSLFFITHFSKIKLLSIVNTQIQLNGFVQLKRLQSLQFLELPNKYCLNDQTIQHLNNLCKLKKLDLTDYTYITDVSPLDNLKLLEELSLSNTRVDDKSIEYSITKMKCLNTLSLDKTNVTSAGVSKLVDLNLKSLSLSNTKIDDDSIVFLSQMKSLKQLNISFNNITDRNMDKLELISSNLTSLDLRGTNTLKSLHLFEGILKVPLKKALELLELEQQQEQQNQHDDQDDQGIW